MTDEIGQPDDEFDSLTLAGVVDEQIAAARVGSSGRSAHTHPRPRARGHTTMAPAAGRGLDEHESPGGSAILPTVVTSAARG